MLILRKLSRYTIKLNPTNINTVNAGYNREPSTKTNFIIIYCHKGARICVSVDPYTYALHVEPYRIQTPTVLPFSYYKKLTIANVEYLFSIIVFDDLTCYRLYHDRIMYQFKNLVNNRFTRCQKTYMGAITTVHYYKLKNNKYRLSYTLDGSRPRYMILLYYRKNKMYKIVIKDMPNNIKKQYINDT